MTNPTPVDTAALSPEIEKRFDTKFGNEEYGPLIHTHKFNTSLIYEPIKQFLAQELSTLETTHRAEVEEAVEAERLKWEKSLKTIFPEDDTTYLAWKNEEKISAIPVARFQESIDRQAEKVRDLLTTTTSERKSK